MDCPRARACTSGMIWPIPQARAISFGQSRPCPEGSPWTFIMPEAEVSIAFSALNSCSVITRWIAKFEWQHVVLTCTRKLTAIRIFYWLFLHTLPIWTSSSEFGTYRLCEQGRFRRACASAQSDAQSHQNLRCSLIQAVSQEEPSDRKPDP